MRVREILALLARGKANCHDLQVHYRTRDDRPPIDIVEQNIINWLDGVIPPDFSVSLFEWQPIVGGYLQPFNGCDYELYFHLRGIRCLSLELSLFQVVPRLYFWASHVS